MLAPREFKSQVKDFTAFTNKQDYSSTLTDKSAPAIHSQVKDIDQGGASVVKQDVNLSRSPDFLQRYLGNSYLQSRAASRPALGQVAPENGDSTHQPLNSTTRTSFDPYYPYSEGEVRSEQEQILQYKMIGEKNPSKCDSAELPVSGEELEPGTDLAQEPTPTIIGPEVDVGEKKAKPCCQFESFTSSNDSYTDTDTDTRKNIKFTYKVKSGSDPKKCVMVNWIQGTAKNKDGTFRKVKMFDETMDYNFPTMRIDSLDKDPVYWSNSSARWNYQLDETDTYYATDSPGPQVWEDGIDYDLKFKMCLYCIDDVSTTSDESGSGVKNSLKCIDWVFKAKFDAAAKKFTH